MINSALKIIICSLVLCGSSAQGQTVPEQSLQAQQTAAKQLSFKKTEHNFGILKGDGSESLCSFEYLNSTDRDIVIYNVVTSCDCTAAQWKRTPVKPGESGSIKVAFKSESAPGKFIKSITVYTSATAKPVILTIKGEITDKE